MDNGKNEMTQLEYDKSIVKDLPPFTAKEYKEIKEDLALFMLEQKETKNFMLLSNEIRYFTIFQRKNALLSSVGAADKVIKFLTEDSFLKTLGKLKVLKRTGTGEIEIWIGDTFFLFFDSDSFFVNM